jgi:hypothetical protein
MKTSEMIKWYQEQVKKGLTIAKIEKLLKLTLKGKI